jgi:hypothetical protein
MGCASRIDHNLGGEAADGWTERRLWINCMVKEIYATSSVTCHQQLHSTSRNAAARRHSYSVRTLGARQKGGKNWTEKGKNNLIWEGKSDVAKKPFKPPLKIETLATAYEDWLTTSRTRLRPRRIQSAALIPPLSVLSACPRPSSSQHTRYTGRLQPFNNGDHVGRPARRQSYWAQPLLSEQSAKKLRASSCTKFQCRAYNQYTSIFTHRQPPV